MSDTPESESANGGGGVLRPFVATETEPLPPVRRPDLPVEDTAPTVPEEITPEDVIEAPNDAPVEGPVPELEPSAHPHPNPDLYDVEAESPIVDEPETDPAGTWFDEIGDDEPPPPAETITIGRTPFFIGAGAIAACILGLSLLWLTGGSDGGSAEVAQPDPEVSTDQPASDPALQDRLATLQSEVTRLEGALADVPVAPLPGTALERISLPTDGRYISAIDSSVGVLGDYGGLSMIDPAAGTVATSDQIAAAGTRVMRTESGVWATNYTGNEIVLFDPVAGVVVGRLAFPGPDGIARHDGSLVVASYDGGFVARVHPSSGDILQQIDVGGSPTAVLVDETAGIWAAVFDTGEIVQIDPDTFEVVRRVTVGAGPVGLALTPNGIWSTNHEEGTVSLVNPETGAVEFNVEVGAGPTDVVGAWGYAWVTVTDDGDLVQIDGNAGTIETRTPLGRPAVRGGPTGITHLGDSLWVAQEGERLVVRVTPALP